MSDPNPGQTPYDGSMDLSRLPHPVYPGHALVLALYAIRAFPSARFALATCKDHHFSELVGSILVPGAGDGAYAADHLLRKIRETPAKLEEHLEWAREEWVRRVGPGTGNHEKSYEPGVQQAKELEELFRAAVSNWDWT